LGTLAAPAAESNKGDELDGLPSEFDGWIFSVTSRTIVQLEDDENPRGLWEELLHLGAFGHKWVGRFFWYWFSDGVVCAPTVGRFAQRWTEMLQYALDHPEWDPSKARAFYVDDMAFEILGYHFGTDSIAKDESYAPQLREMSGVLGEAASKWFGMEQVACGFADNVVRPAYKEILCLGVQWLHRAVAQADEYDLWRNGRLEEPLLNVLTQCWERHPSFVASDPELRNAFLELLKVLAARGSHGALQLRDRILSAISTGG
jgi:hypothetical protein